ncbi:MAG: Nudix family hydrolase [Gammaproteobacteria bacterium]|nr:Nudix family hydrolase [Gammaproteobacteria bacterium]
MPSTGPDSARKIVRIAVGVLRRRNGEVLIAQRPDGKEAAGWWEFPGGKIEAAESVEQALHRELHEELGVRVQSARRLIVLRHDYPHKTVELDTWLVDNWLGEPQPLEQQALAWSAPDRLGDYRLLPADGPILSALRLPARYLITRPKIHADELVRRLPSLPSDALLRLRLPTLGDSDYRRLAEQVAGYWAVDRLILDRDPALSGALGAGWHASEASLFQLDRRPSVPLAWVLASCHDAKSLARARELGFDAAVLGPVQPTPSHPLAPTLGWSAFGALAANAGLPVYAIGGVGPPQLTEAWRAGAQGVAGISAWFDGK